MLRYCTETLSSMRAVCQKLHAACEGVHGWEMRQLSRYPFLDQFQFHLAAYPVSREEGTVPPARGCRDISLPSPCNQTLAEQSLQQAKHHLHSIRRGCL